MEILFVNLDKVHHAASAIRVQEHLEVVNCNIRRDIDVLVSWCRQP